MFRFFELLGVYFLYTYFYVVSCSISFTTFGRYFRILVVLVFLCTLLLVFIISSKDQSLLRSVFCYLIREISWFSPLFDFWLFWCFTEVIHFRFISEEVCVFLTLLKSGRLDVIFITISYKMSGLFFLWCTFRPYTFSYVH